MLIKKNYKQIANILLLVLSVILIAGCTSKDLDKPSIKNLTDVEYNINKNGKLQLKKTHKLKNSSKAIASTTIVNNKYEKIPNFEKNYIDNIKLKQQKVKKSKILVEGNNVKISVESIPINEFIDLVFSNVLKLNYTVDEDVKNLKNTITLNMLKTQPAQEAFDVVSKLLSINNISVKKENGVLFISKKTKSSGMMKQDEASEYIVYGRSISNDIPDSENILLFIPYNYINPKKAVNILRKAGVGKVKFSYTIKGMQMMQGTAGEIRQAIEVVKLIDRPYLDGKTPYLIEFNNIEVDKFIFRMKSIFLSNGIVVTTMPSKGGILMSPIPELNSILVISPKQSWVDMLLFWKDKLDIISEITTEPSFYTYKVKNRKADELTKAINSVIDVKLTSVNKSKLKDTIESKKSKNKESTTISQPIKYKVSADLPTNTIMMKLLPSEYRELLPLIEQLDALPLQVLAEITLAEVTLTDTFNLGFEYALKNNKALISSPFDLIDGVISGGLGGKGIGAVYQTKNINSIVNTYAEKKLLNILSKPKILILNNETGSINVGSQVPIMTTESSSEDLSAITRNVSYQSTGISIGLTPTINSNGILTMKINLNLSEAQLNSTSSIDSPLIINRTLSTVLTLKNNDTVLLGGLISTNNSITDSGVPGLMDIPYLGNIFKFKSKKITKTELIILIKPFIIQTPKEMTNETRRYKSIMKLLDGYNLF